MKSITFIDHIIRVSHTSNYQSDIPYNHSSGIYICIDNTSRAPAPFLFQSIKSCTDNTRSDPSIIMK